MIPRVFPDWRCRHTANLDGMESRFVHNDGRSGAKESVGRMAVH